MSDKRVIFDFEIEFSNGGGIQGQDFRLDIAGDTIGDEALAEYIVKDLRLLMVGSVRILNRRVVEEPHKRSLASSLPDIQNAFRTVDLSHVIESGMVTYKGLPGPVICDYLSRVRSREFYAPGVEFNIGRIDMVANTGTYLDTPFHRFEDGDDLSAVPLERLSNLPGIVVRVLGGAERPIDWTHFAALDLRGRAVLVNTGWDRHWRTDQYFEGHPFLTQAAAEYLREGGAMLVGIDSLNIDDTADVSRPVHTTLLRAGIPIVEHMTSISVLPVDGFTFAAVPPKIRSLGTFPVSAYATVLRDL